MNLSVLKKMLPGLVPLFIFILADEVWGTEIGLYVALGFGVVEFLFYFIKDKTVDKFILLDTALLLIMGGISIVLENDIFFKIKPALIEAILLSVIAFSVWGPRNLLMTMSKRYMGEIHLDPEQEKMMHHNMLALFWITAFHIMLVLFSAAYMSKEAWVFISGILLYILYGIYFVLLFIKIRINNKRFKKEEWFPVVNNEGMIIGKAPRSVCHNGKSLFLHPVVHLHLFDNSGKLFLQKRSTRKDIQPGKWDTSVGGHVDLGERIEDALARETREEIGLKHLNPRYIDKYIWESSHEKELVHTFFAITEEVPDIDKTEIDEGRFWTIKEIKNSIGKEIFTPNFEHEFQKYLKKG